MTPLPGKKRFSPIGIELKDASLCAVQLVFANGQPHVHAATRVPIGDPDDRNEVTQTLREFAAGGQFRGREVVTALPRMKTDVRPVRLPPNADPAKRDDFLRAIHKLVDNVLPFDLSEAVLDYLPLGVTELNGKKRYLALLTSARRADVDRHLRLLREAGLQCVSLDVAPCAAARCIGYGHSDTVAAVELDCRSSVVTVSRGPNVLLSRVLRWGTGLLATTVANDLDLSLPDALDLLKRHGLQHRGTVSAGLEKGARDGVLPGTSLAHLAFEVCTPVLTRLSHDLTDSLDYFLGTSPEHAIKRVLLTGEPPCHGLQDFLAPEFAVPVELDDWAKRGFIGPNSPPDNGTFTIAAGLALRGEQHA